MTLQLFAHPLSSYSWKALIALWENDTPFTYRTLAQPENAVALARAWPLAKFPVLLDGDTPIMEATSIIEHLAVHHRGPVVLIPDDPAAALPVRQLDRIFDNHVMTPMQAIVFDALRSPDARDQLGVARARATLDTIYPWLDVRLAGRTWAAGDDFSLADCAAAPSLFYADWTHPIPDDCATLKAYRARLLARPSIARAVDEARPYRDGFPLGAPDRD